MTSIGLQAFYGCGSIKSITIPSSVTSIADQAFYDCDSLKTVTVLGDKPATLGSGVFDECKMLKAIYVPASENGMTEDLYKAGWTAYSNLIKVKPEEEVVVVDGVRYTIKNGVVTVTGFEGDVSDVEIAETVEDGIEDGHKVTAVHQKSLRAL